MGRKIALFAGLWIAAGMLISGSAHARQSDPESPPAVDKSTENLAAETPGPVMPNPAAPTPEGPPAANSPVNLDAALHHSAVLGGLDKITAKVSHIHLEQDVPAIFGSLEIILRTCKANPPEEAPEVTAFLEISDISNHQPPKPLFKGWMFASSPSLSALDHPIYDVWVISCKTSPAEASSSSR